MIVITILVLCGLVAVAALIAGLLSRSPVPYVVAGGAGLLLIAILFFGSMTVVDPKHVGIVTTFGKTTDVLDNGFHWVAPWRSVTQWDGTIQRMSLAGSKGDDNEVSVRLADHGTARLDVTLQWRVNVGDKDGIKTLAGDYQQPERVDENFVEHHLRAALNDAFASYDPLASLGGADTPVRSASDVGNEALVLLRDRIKTGGITLLTLTIAGTPRYDDGTERRINDFRALLAQKKNAATERDIADLRSQSNNKLAEGAKDAGTLYRNCLDITAAILREGRALPPAWNCGTPPPAVINVR